MRALNTARTLLPSRKAAPQLEGDLVAGDTIGIVALPSRWPRRQAPGAGAASGLITAVIDRVVAAVFGGSTIQVWPGQGIGGMQEHQHDPDDIQAGLLSAPRPG